MRMASSTPRTWGATVMNELEFSDPDAARLARLFVDLMATLAEDGAEDDDAVATISSLWTPGPGGRPHLEMTPETLVHGLGAVIAALARELAAEREASGRPDASVSAVWREVAVALSPPMTYGEGTNGSNQVSPPGSS